MSHDNLAPPSGPTTRPFAYILALTLALLVLTACGAGAPTNTGAAEITLLIDSATAAPDTIGVQLRDLDQAPITDATVKIEGNMNHAGMVPVQTEAVQDNADGTVDGVYQLPFQFTMLGDWIITVEATLSDGSRVTQDIHLGVNETGVQIHE